jgi:hypothetical protein
MKYAAPPPWKSRFLAPDYLITRIKKTFLIKLAACAA